MFDMSTTVILLERWFFILTLSTPDIRDQFSWSSCLSFHSAHFPPTCLALLTVPFSVVKEVPLTRLHP